MNKPFNYSNDDDVFEQLIVMQDDEYRSAEQVQREEDNAWHKDNYADKWVQAHLNTFEPIHEYRNR